MSMCRLALDILVRPGHEPGVFDDDIMRERGVILEEIKMDEDNPDYLVHEIFTQNFWKDHPLGKPILGTKETVRTFEQDMLFDYYGTAFSRQEHDFFGGGESGARRVCGAGRRGRFDRWAIEPVTGWIQQPAPRSRIVTAQ